MNEGTTQCFSFPSPTFEASDRVTVNSSRKVAMTRGKNILNGTFNSVESKVARLCCQFSRRIYAKFLWFLFLSSGTFIHNLDAEKKMHFLMKMRLGTVNGGRIFRFWPKLFFVGESSEAKGCVKIGLFESKKMQKRLFGKVHWFGLDADRMGK